MNAENIKFLSVTEMKESRVYYELTIPNIINKCLISIVIIFVVFLGYIFFAEYDHVVRVRVKIRPNAEIVNVFSLYDGNIAEINFENGKFVSANSVLYTLENSHIKKQIDLLLEKKIKISKEIEKENYILALLNNFNLQDHSFNQIQVPKEDSGIFVYNEIIKYNAEFLLAKKNYENEKTLYPKFTSKNSVDNYKKKMNDSKIALENYICSEIEKRKTTLQNLQLEKNTVGTEIKKYEYELSNTIIKSPIDGYVEEIVPLMIGKNIFCEDLILKIIPDNETHTKVNLYTNIEDIAELKEGMEFVLFFSKYSTAEYIAPRGKIVRIPKDTEKLDTSFCYKVIGELESNKIINRRTKKEIKLISGMEGQCKIITRKEPLYLFFYNKFISQ